MRKAILLPQGADLIGRVCGLIEASGAGPEKSLVLFPGRRPGTILAQRLAGRRGRALMAPHCRSMDDWAAETAQAMGFENRVIEADDGAALIYRLHPDCQLPGGGRQLLMEEFLSWGFKLFSDFEELKHEAVTPGGLESVKDLAEEPMPESFGRQLGHLGRWYGDFYEKLSEQGLATGASTCAWLAEHAREIDTSRHSRIILAGFYAPTRTEQAILGALLERPDSVLVLRDGPGIAGTIERLGVRPEREGRPGTGPGLKYQRAADSHGQVAALPGIIAPGPELDGTVLVLPKEDTVFPVINHLLPGLGKDWNISMGYPLARTPLWSLVSALAQACEGRDGDSYFLPHYLRLMLHPYVKNLSLDGASYPTRILLHAIEEALARRSRRLVSLEAIEGDAEIRREASRRMAGLLEGGQDEASLWAHLAGIHQLLLRPFERVSSVGDFGRKMMAVVSAVSARSTAGSHPYAGRFFYHMADVLTRLGESMLAGQEFKTVGAYFGLLEHFAGQVRVPFPGSPLRGLQVLGFWETRGLTFRRVVVLDANEGTIPGGSSVDTVLPQALRRELGLKTSRDRELIDRYHFQNLVHGASEAVLCYSQGGGAQRSRFLEQLAWDREKAEGKLRQGGHRLVHFRASFSQEPPGPIAKTPAMMEAISRLSYSATMLDCYLHCGRKFCLHYLLNVREKEEVDADLDATDVGKLVHRALNLYFRDRRERDFECSEPELRAMDAVVEGVFEDQFGRGQDGNIYLVKSQVRRRMRQLLWHHRDRMPEFRVVDCEWSRSPTVDLPGVGLVPVNGTLDRIDRRGDEIVIVDYKKSYGKPPSFERFIESPRQEWPHWLRSVQQPLYIMIYLAESRGANVSGVNSELLLMGPREFKRAVLFGEKADRSAQFEAYQEAIATLVGEIRDPEAPFGDTWKPQEECGRCPYKVLCGRQWVGDRNW